MRETKVIEDRKGYFKMHWDLLRDDSKYELSIDEVVMLEYVLAVYPILETKCMINGVEYGRLSNSFINKYLDWSIPKINRLLKRLEEEDFIDISNVNSKGRKCTHGARYIHLNTEIKIPDDKIKTPFEV